MKEATGQQQTELSLDIPFAPNQKALLVTNNTIGKSGLRYMQEFVRCYTKVHDTTTSNEVHHVKKSYDLVFGNSPEAMNLANQKKAQFIPVDYEGLIARHLDSNEFISFPSPKRIVILGCESTGKTWLCHELARHFNGVLTEEYARTYFSFFGDKGTIDDIPVTSRGQIATERAVINAFSPEYVFCDSDLLLTRIWSDILFGECPDSVEKSSKNLKPDLTLVTDLDIPWQPDPQRCLPEKKDRENFHRQLIRELELNQRPMKLISGTMDERVALAAKYVKEFSG